MSDKQGRNIAIVGASGSVGSQTVEALLAYGIHTLTAISRSESTATFPAGVKVQRGPYENEEFLVTALRGQDVLILQVGIMALDSQIPLISAAAKASVPWVIPCEFASDNKHEKLNQEINLMTRKNKYREQIEQLLRFAGIAQGEDHIAVIDDAHVAVQRIHAVEEDGGGTGAGERGGNLRTDVAGFTDAAGSIDR